MKFGLKTLLIAVAVLSACFASFRAGRLVQPEVTLLAETVVESPGGARWAVMTIYDGDGNQAYGALWVGVWPPENRGTYVVRDADGRDDYLLCRPVPTEEKDRARIQQIQLLQQQMNDAQVRINTLEKEKP